MLHRGKTHCKGRELGDPNNRQRQEPASRALSKGDRHAQEPSGNGGGILTLILAAEQIFEFFLELSSSAGPLGERFSAFTHRLGNAPEVTFSQSALWDSWKGHL
jgi:hypothetical protein